MPFTSAELDAMRDEMEVEFDQTATRRRKATLASDGYGGVTSSTNSDVSLACRVRHVREGSERVEGGGLRAVRTWKFLFAHDADIVATDQIILGGATYDILAIDPAKSDKLSLVVDCVLTT